MCPNATTLSSFLHDELPGEAAHSIESHVNTCAECQDVLQGLVGGYSGPIDALTTLCKEDAIRSVSLATSIESAEHTVPAPPPHMPGYELIEVLGRGGMGVVYKARQLRPNRIVALKMLLTGRHASSKERERFLREAGSIAQLQHPYIVSLYEAGEHGELPYLTLEYVSGGNLGAMLRRTPLPPQDAARIVEQLARGTHYAHERGIIHRDLKPANVLLQVADLGLRKDGNPAGLTPGPEDTLELAQLESAIPKITDFGLAKNVDSAELTSTNAVCGTPSYMSPEQASGTTQQIGIAADVYALGAILYECLTSRPPFHGPTAADTLMQVLHNDPVSPSRLQPTVPRDLETICLKCLQKRPHQRYASAHDLAEDLRRYQAGESIHARPVGRWERIVKWCVRRPAVAALLGLVLLLIVVGGSLVTWQWREAVAALAEARAEKSARAQRQVAALPDAVAGSVPAILEELHANRDEMLPLLRQRYEQEKVPLRRMRLAIALLPDDPQLRHPLLNWMLQAEDPAEVLLVREALKPHQRELVPTLWAKAEHADAQPEVRFRALVALADYEPDDPRWQKLGPEAVEQLTWSNPLHRSLWTKALGPVSNMLSAPLTDTSYFPLREGFKWHYQVESSDGKKDHPLMMQIAKIEQIDGLMLARLETTRSGSVVNSEHLKSTAKGLFRHRYNGTEVSPPMPLLRFPVKVGDSWEGDHRHGSEPLKVRCQISAEEVEVPAGKFKSIVLRLEATLQDGSLVTTYWFAEGVGMVKQAVSFGPNSMVVLLERFENGERK